MAQQTLCRYLYYRSKRRRTVPVLRQIKLTFDENSAKEEASDEVPKEHLFTGPCHEEQSQKNAKRDHTYRLSNSTEDSTMELHASQRPLGIPSEKVSGGYDGFEGGRSHHHVAGNEFLPLQYDPIIRQCSKGVHVDRKYGITHITKPTGNTKPLKSFTSPGLLSFKPADPPDTISESRPPKDSITPARTFEPALTRRFSSLRCGVGGCTYRLKEHVLIPVCMFRDSSSHHRHSDFCRLQSTF